MRVLPSKSGKPTTKKTGVKKQAMPKRNPIKAAKSAVKSVKRTSGNTKSGKRMIAGNPAMKAMAQPGMSTKPVSTTKLVQQGVAKKTTVPSTKGIKY